jgi:hypothetical protein
MLVFILIIIYSLSIIGCKYVYLLQSSKYLDNFNDEDCTVDVLWFMPAVNTLAVIIVFMIGFYFSRKWVKPNKSKFINWLCNFDLIKDKPF